MHVIDDSHRCRPCNAEVRKGGRSGKLHHGNTEKVLTAYSYGVGWQLVVHMEYSTQVCGADLDSLKPCRNVASNPSLATPRRLCTYLFWIAFCMETALATEPWHRLGRHLAGYICCRCSVETPLAVSNSSDILVNKHATRARARVYQSGSRTWCQPRPSTSWTRQHACFRAFEHRQHACFPVGWCVDAARLLQNNVVYNRLNGQKRVHSVECCFKQKAVAAAESEFQDAGFAVPLLMS